MGGGGGGWKQEIGGGARTTTKREEYKEIINVCPSCVSVCVRGHSQSSWDTVKLLYVSYFVVGLLCAVHSRAPYHGSWGFLSVAGGSMKFNFLTYQLRILTSAEE